VRSCPVTDQLRTAIARDDFYVRWDVPGQNAGERLARTRQLIFELGRQFRAWPAIVGAARELASTGHGLDGPLEEVARS
jgi:hypothetical protein